MTNKGLLGAGIGLAGLGYAIYTQIKMELIANKLSVTVDALSAKTEVQIEESMLHAAAEKAVDREVLYIARKAATQATIEVKDVMRKEICTAVNAQYENISKSVSDEIAVQVSKINKSSLQKSISDKAERLVVNKFDHQLDDLLDAHTKKLESVDRIYSEIGDRLKTRGESKTISLNI